MSQTSKIIYSLLLFFIFSSIFLFWKSDQGLNPNYQKNWWAVSFQGAQNENLSFAIENHSANNNFSWEIISEKDNLKKGSASIARGEKKNIELDLSNLTGKVFVRVSDGKEYQEIYKNL